MTSSVIIAAVRQYTTYKNKRAAVKKQHRVELEELTHEELVAFGEAAYNARDAGFRIEEILEALGQKNRNLLYAALKAYKERLAEDDDDSTPEKPFDPVPRSSVRVEMLNGNRARIILADGDSAEVTYNAQGRVIDMPEKYLRNLDSSTKEQLTEALKLIQERANS